MSSTRTLYATPAASSTTITTTTTTTSLSCRASRHIRSLGYHRLKPIAIMFSHVSVVSAMLVFSSVLLPLPLQVIDEFGADSLRLYIMFMGPVDAVKPWDTSRVSGTST